MVENSKSITVIPIDSSAKVNNDPFLISFDKTSRENRYYKSSTISDSNK
jgi:hypothetical protein